MKKSTFTLLTTFIAATAISGNLSERLGPSASRSVPVHFALNIPTGETISDLDYPVLIDQIDVAFMTTGKSFKMERIRELLNIPYISHHTNDGEVVDWQVTEGTTFKNYDEVFAGPLVTYEGDNEVYHTDKMTSSPVYYVDSSIVQWLRLNHEVGGTRGLGPCVYYSFATNALYLSSVTDNPEKWTSLGNPGKFTYGRYHRPMEGTFPAIVNNETGVTNFLDKVTDRKNVYSSILFEGVTMPTSLMSADGTMVPISFVPGHTITNFAVWSTCSMTVTNTLVDITSCGKSLSTNLNGTTILSRDVIRVSGTATPTCHIIGVGRK